MVIETIGVCFLVCRKYVSNSRHLTSEACTHVYSGYHMVNLKSSVLEMMQLVEKYSLGLVQYTRVT